MTAEKEGEMPDIDVETMSRDELESLKSEVDKALTTLESRRKAEAKKAAEEAAKAHGFSLNELVGPDRGSKRPQIKYRNPDNPAETWSGRGRKPRWLKEAMANGRSLDELAA